MDDLTCGRCPRSRQMMRQLQARCFWTKSWHARLERAVTCVYCLPSRIFKLCYHEHVFVRDLQQCYDVEPILSQTDFRHEVGANRKGEKM